VTTGEGGVITTDDDDIAERARTIRNQGQRERYEYDCPGFNFRMTEVQAALGVAQMTRLQGIVETRCMNARMLTAGLAGIEGLVTPTQWPERRHVFHQYTVRVTGEARLTRDELLQYLEAHGIGCAVYYPRPVFDYDCFRNDPRLGTPTTPRADRISGEVLSLPVHPKLTNGELTHIVEAVRDALR
jgi:dTDP-4-amino-4,6-dideoxygalactose transaminase